MAKVDTVQTDRNSTRVQEDTNKELLSELFCQDIVQERHGQLSAQMLSDEQERLHEFFFQKTGPA